MQVNLLYEYLDILLDMFQKLPFILQSEQNHKVIFMLREPAKYVDFIELILEGINDRLINKPLEISESQMLSSARRSPKSDTAGHHEALSELLQQIQIYRLLQQLGKQI
jgi:hypothetical protein